MSHPHGLALALDFLRSGARHFVLTSHARPDGDAIGSVLGLSFVLDQLGLTSDVVLADPIPSVYRQMPGSERIQQRSAIEPGEIPVVVLECDSTARTGVQGLDNRPLLNIDHHSSGRAFGTSNWIEPSACAVGAMIYELAVAAGVTITPNIATCLYIAVLSDTAAFTNGATTPATLALAASLAAHGADPAALARDIFANSESKLRLLGTALRKMGRAGRIAWTAVTLDELRETGADVEDCEGIVNYLISMLGIESAVFLRELPGGQQFRLSLRSKGSLDVAAIAESFGGGGHRTASGCTLDGPLEFATERVLNRIERSLSATLSRGVC